MKRRLIKITGIILSAVMAASIASAPVSAQGFCSIGDAETPERFQEDYTRHNCVDISTWNGDLDAEDWQAMKDAGVDSVIIRAGYSALNSGKHKKDARFENNMKNAKKAGMQIGVYYFTTALNEEEAAAEAEYTLDLIRPYREDITLPVVYDFETNRNGRLNRYVLEEMGSDAATSLCCAFCDTIGSEGYAPMVYASRYVLDGYLDKSVLESRYEIWLAQYTSDLSAPEYEGEYTMWQYSSRALIDGIERRFDANYLYTAGKSMPEEEAMDNIMEISGSGGTEEVTPEEEPGKTDKEPPAEYVHKKAEEKEKKSEETAAEKNIVYTADNSKVCVPVKSSGKTAEVQVKDKRGFTHCYTIYKKSKNTTESEAALASLFTGFFTSSGKQVTISTVKKKVVPAFFEAGDGDLSLKDMNRIMKRLGLNCVYRKEAGEFVYQDIKTSLAKGYPVLVDIDAKNKKWKNTHLMLLLGMDSDGNAIAADFQDRKWSKTDQRVKVVNVDEIISYINKGYIHSIASEKENPSQNQ